jgi:hypothetical protein
LSVILDSLPPVLRDAVRLALGDLRYPVAVPLEKVTFETDPDDDRFGTLIVWFADGSAGGFGLEIGRDPAEVTGDVADQIQELFHEERELLGVAAADLGQQPEVLSTSTESWSEFRWTPESLGSISRRCPG